MTALSVFTSASASVIAVVVAVVFVSLSVQVQSSKTPSGLYHDDGNGHTILTQKFSKKDVREISHDILSIMGLHHRPHPNLVDSKSPGSQFLWEIYNSISSTDEMSERGVDLRNWADKGDGGDGDTSEGEDGWISNKKNLTWSQFNVNQAEIEAISHADSIISFVNRGHRFSNVLKGYEEDKQFWFDISEVSEAESFVLGAELRIWKRTLIKPKKQRHHHHYTDKESNGLTEAEVDDVFGGDVLQIAVKQIVPDEHNESFQEIELDEIVVAKWEQGWLRLNVTPAFRSWMATPNKNFGLVLSVKTADDGREVPMKASGLATILDPEEHQPFLVSFLTTIGTGRANEMNMRRKNPATTGTKHRRVIRSPEPSQNGGGGVSNSGGSAGSSRTSSTGGNGGGSNGRARGQKKSKKSGRQYDFFKDSSLYKDRSCQMGMLYVNFEDLGWKDWVIAPDGFIAYYCHGECSFPLTASMNATNHAIVSTLVHTYYPLEYPRASCAPIKLGSISMLYYDDNSNVTVKKYKDMVIKSCGCK